MDAPFSPSHSHTQIFGAGKLVCTGARTIHQAIYTINAVIEKLQKAGYDDARFSPLQTENMVASVRTPWRFDLAKLHREHTEFCDYEPDLFPGVAFHHPDLGRIAILVFESGKMVVTGVRLKKNICDALDTAMPYIMTSRRVEKRAREGAEQIADEESQDVTDATAYLFSKKQKTR